jgi:hypothetical protein
MKITDIITESSNQSSTLDQLPAKPGTVPIPPGTVRLYHQTSEEALQSIMKTGLTISHAQGIEGPRAIYASETGFYGKPDSRPTLEFYVAREYWENPFVLEDVPPEQMIAAHFPWHRQARYIESHPKVKQEVLAGKHDNLTGDYARAVEYVKKQSG